MSLQELFHGRRIPGVYYDRVKNVPGGPEHFKLKLTVTERTIPLGDQRET